MAGLVSMLAAAPLAAEVPRVAVDLPAVHSLVSAVMGDLGEPEFLMQPGASPHSYQMRPSEARILEDAEVIFWVSGTLSPWLDEAIVRLNPDADSVELVEAPGTRRLEFRETAVFGDPGAGGHGHADRESVDGGRESGEEGHGEHDGHEGHDGHDLHEGHEGHEGHEEHDGHGDHDDHEGRAGHEGHDGHDGHDGHGEEDAHGDHGGHKDSPDREGHAEVVEKSSTHGEKDGHGEFPEDPAGDHAGHGHGGEAHEVSGHELLHAHAGTDPHAWLDPVNGMVWLGVIAEVLAEKDPAHAALYEANAAAAREDLEALVGELENTLTPVRGRGFVVFHDSFQYLENRFGVEAVGAISFADASAPGPRRLREVREAIAAAGVRCVLAEPQFDPGLVETVAEGQAVRVREIDPLGVGLEPGPALYGELLRGIAGTLVDCLEE